MNIKQLRQGKGFTTEQVAEKMGISRSYYTQMELGIRHFNKERIGQLSKILDVEEGVIRKLATSVADEDLWNKHWMSKMSVKGKPILFSFGESAKDDPKFLKSMVTSKFVDFLIKSMSEEVKKELTTNKELRDFIYEKVKLLKK